MQKLSHSARETLETCSYKYELHYNRRLRSVNTSSALLFGSAFDESLNVLLLERDLEKAKQVFLDQWLRNEHNYNIVYYKMDHDLSLLDSDLLWDLAGVTDAVKRKHYECFFTLEAKGLKMLEAYHAEILPKIKRVIEIQKSFELPFAEYNGIVRGVIDLVAEIELVDGTVVAAILDNKSTSQPYTKNSYKTKEQLALYQAALLEYKYVGFLTLNKKTFATQIIVGEFDADVVCSTLEKFENAFKQIAAKDFQKNKKGCYAFGMDCIFKSHCFGKGFDNSIYEKIDG
jgi:hypothetical protein